MYNILTLNKIAACGTDIFDKAKYTVSDNAENPTAIMVRSAKTAVILFFFIIMVYNTPVHKNVEK